MASDGPGRVNGLSVTPAEEEELRLLAARPDIYEAVAKSIAPSIYGSMGGWMGVVNVGMYVYMSVVLLIIFSYRMSFVLLLLALLCQKIMVHSVGGLGTRV